MRSNEQQQSGQGESCRDVKVGLGYKTASKAFDISVSRAGNQLRHNLAKHMGSAVPPLTCVKHRAWGTKWPGHQKNQPQLQ